MLAFVFIGSLLEVSLNGFFTKSFPGWNYCNSKNLCSTGFGDCDKDTDCQLGLKCVNDVGAKYGWNRFVDVCEANLSFISRSCVDSDDGKNYEERGIVTVRMPGIDRALTKSDKCLDDKRLEEWYCYNNQYAAKVTFACENGCYEGECNTTLECIPTCEQCEYDSFCVETGTKRCTREDCSSYIQECTRITEGITCGEMEMCVNGVCITVSGEMGNECLDGTPLGSCSQNKPLYCNLYGELLNRGSLCGCPEGYGLSGERCVSTISNKCSNIISNVIINGDSNDKLDVVFIPVGFESLEEFSSVVLEHIDVDARYKGLLYYEPFKSDFNKFNFFKTRRLPTEIEENFLQRRCQFSDSPYVYQCTGEIKNWLLENDCIYDKALVVYKNEPNEGPAFSEALNGVIAIISARTYPPFDVIEGNSGAVHEFAHLLGLTDQKIRDHEFLGYGMTVEETPNCDVAGCPKWCQDYIREPFGTLYLFCKDLPEDECTWNIGCLWRNVVDEYWNTQCVPLDHVNGGINIGLNCLEGTGCYYNCNGLGAWRSATYTSMEEGHRSTSLMFYLNNALGFDAVDRRFLESVLSEYN